ncbi:MAG TPA: hypothetical protein VF751_12000 [Chthoniobacterales bacterium]
MGATFHRGMQAWLKGTGYQIGLSGQDVKPGKELDWAKSLMNLGIALVGNVPMVADSGGDAETFFHAMIPLLPLADLIGFKLKAGTPLLLVVIYADDLEHPVVLDRFAKLFELAEPLANLGLRLNGRAQGAVLVCPVIVYFNPDKFAVDMPILKPLGYTKKFMHQVVVDPVYVNVPAQEVAFRESSGFMDNLIKKVNSLMGLKYPLFDRTDLSQVLFLAQQSA